MDTGEVWQVVDVLMNVDEAVLHLHHFVVSLLCTLSNIEEEEASCLVGVVEVDVQNHDGEDGEGSGHVLPGTFLQLYLLSSHIQRGFWVPERGPAT